MLVFGPTATFEKRFADSPVVCDVLGDMACSLSIPCSRGVEDSDLGGEVLGFKDYRRGKIVKRSSIRDFPLRLHRLG